MNSNIPKAELPKADSFLEYTINFSQKFPGRIWSKGRQDLTIATVGTIYDLYNVTVGGKEVKADLAKGVTCEVRLSPEDYETLQMEVAQMPSVCAQVVVKLTREPIFNYLTVGGQEVPSLLFYGELETTSEGVSNMMGLAFESQDEVNDFLIKARQLAKEKADNARERRQAELKAAKAALQEEGVL